MFDRRTFLKVIGGGAVGVLLTPAPWKSLYDAAYWTQNWSWIPRLKYGENAYVPTVSKICPSGTGVVIRTVNGRPVRALGSENNVLSQGGLSALAATETQLACAPSRVKYPLKRTADGMLLRITWAEAEQIFLDKVSVAKQNIACLSGDQTGSINDLFSAFLKKLGSQQMYRMPSEEQNAQIAWKKMGGEGKLGYNIEEADYIFAIGANYLESWGTTVYNRRDYSKKRPVNGVKELTLAYAGSAETNTAAGADYFLPCRVQSELTIALGVAHLIMKQGVRSPIRGFREFQELAEQYTPSYVAELTGIPEAKFIEAVTALIKAKKPLVIVGSEANMSIGALPIMAGIACNMLLNKTNNPQTGLLTSLPFPQPALEESDSYEVILERDIVRYAQKVAQEEQGAPALLCIYEANPVYALPKNTKIKEFIEKSDFVVSCTNFLDETSKMADLVLPSAMDFERFDDVYTPYGSGFVNYSAGQPACVPAYEARPVADLFFALAKSLDMPFDIGNAGELVAMKAEAIGADMDSLLEGESFIGEPLFTRTAYHFNADSIAKGAHGQASLAVAPSSVLGMGTATTGIPPFATKIITNKQLVGTTMIAQINKATADKLGLIQGSVVNLVSDFGKVQVGIALFEGVQNDTFLVPTNLGHTAFDAFSQNKGENIINLTSHTYEEATGASLYSPLYVKAERV